MNRDLVAAIPGALILPDLAPGAAALMESAVPDAIAKHGVERLLGLGAAEYLGGSAFNAARIAAFLNRAENPLELAFFGIAGAVGDAYPHLEALRGWQVDVDGVEQSASPPATCLAMVESGGRTLLTASGANAGIADFLARESEKLAVGIARCDLVHVTSYLHPKAPALIATVLSRARQLNPGLLVSLDPGAAWILPGGENLTLLLAQTNILHLNSEEFAHMGGHDTTASLAARLAPSRRLIVARTHLGATVYEDMGDGALEQKTLPDTPLPPAIVDANGAGDTFCGGFLWHFATHANDPLTAARRGFLLARTKIVQNGPLNSMVLDA
ncbi:carbohydrate kinase family protein [Devosia faecipullorum]|uniref:carbohydrate kinase family protein n=1 Tax=Devosia faecipullorum TaxID=2755039 RepID=UPI00187BBCED|nr:carbohydrate kinase family protein [Devosia faecipullorum]MBE7731716.1 carbohydrate kinase family protein [Devosia faecipullorum]